MEDNNLIKKKKKNYYKYHNNQNRNYYYKKKKKKLIIENNEVDNILLCNNENDIDETEILQKKDNRSIIEEEPKRKIVQVIEENGQDYEEMDFIPKRKKSQNSIFDIIKSLFQKKIFKYGFSIFILAIALLGTSYSFFSYRKADSRQADISSGEVYVRLVENTANMTLNRMYPRSNEEARSRNDNYIDFTVKAKNTSETKSIYYTIDITNGENVSGKTRINPQYILVDLEEKVNNTYTYIKEAVPLSSFSFSNEVKPNTTSEVTKEYRIRVWVSDAIIISDTETGATYTQSEFNNLYGTFNVTVDSTDGAPTLTGEEKLLAAIEAKQNADINSCNPVWVDNNETVSDESDDITYFSGSNDCVDMNYVWYSGKLWRITAIYPDGSMKLVTEDMITSIFWGSDTEYDGSWVYQWLNEDFYDTLVNPNSIIEINSTWNYSEDGNSTPVKPETIATQKVKTAPVGLLNAYEYYNGYYNTVYLNIGYYWWLITPYSTSYVRFVSNYGTLSNSLPSDSARGVRPSIVIKSGLEFTGDGSKSSPYIIKEDKEDVVNNTTLLSSRSIGEYVKFNNDLYRIVDTSDGITKLTRVDYLRESGTVITKNFASSAYYGKSTNTGSDTYWDYYLNNTWYNSISSTYKNMLVDGIYYLGLYGGNTNYKATICKDADLNSVITKNCTKYTSTDTDKTWTGKVGLPRVGEMFSSQLGSGYSTSSPIWTITPYSTSSVHRVSNGGTLGNISPSSNAFGVRPSINLKSGIKITGGTGYVGGDTNSPFEISE